MFTNHNRREEGRYIIEDDDLCLVFIDAFMLTNVFDPQLNKLKIHDQETALLIFLYTFLFCQHRTSYIDVTSV